MQNISAFNTQAYLVASNTFPVGFPITNWADDSDPLDVPAIQIGNAEMGINGDLVVWAKAAKIPMTLNVIPGSPTDILLSILFQANRVGKNKGAANDQITISFILPDGTTYVFSPGIITDGMAARSISSEGRQKSKSYTFAFEGYF